MLGIIRSEWTRSRVMLGTWIMLGFVLLFYIGANALTLSYYRSEYGMNEPEVNLAELAVGLLPAYLLILSLSAVRLSGSRGHNLHAQSFLVIPARWQQLFAQMFVNAALSMVTMAVAVGASLAMVATLPQKMNTDQLPLLGWTILFAGLISLMASAIGVLIPSSAGAVALPLVWATAVELIAQQVSEWVAEYIAPYLPFNNIWMILGGNVSVGKHDTPVSVAIVCAWTLVLVVWAFFVHQRRDVK
ncbi:ABC transporter permease [Corynebacterium macclintockiae]|uniref:ABC transporter permease n=1 Tax=Corynebacterium macclintockiae TaxID=2913501 RepID=UPI000556E9C9